MFKKTDLRPAYAAASGSDKPINNKSYEHATFSSQEANDFNSFASASSSKSRRQKPPRRDMTLEINTRSLIIAAVSIVAAVLLIILVSSVISLSNKNAKFENNAYICYKDAEGFYRIAKNGREIDDVFTDETTLTPAADNSFAYITVDTENGYDVYLLEAGRPKLLCTGVESVLALSEFKPGVVYLQNKRMSYCFDDADIVLTSSEDKPSNVVISPDGETIAYNTVNKNNPELLSLYLYHTENTSADAATSASETMIPVTVSNKGKYILAYAENAGVKELYAITEGEKYKIEGVNGSFDAVVYKNTTDTEIVFTAKSADGKNETYVYNCKVTGARKGSYANHIASGKSVPQITDSKIVRLDTVKKSYFMNLDNKTTFYLNNKYSSTNIAGFLGEFSPDYEYFYFINEQKQVLCKMKVHNGKTEVASVIAYDVDDFKVTEKGNVYYLDRYFDFYFYKLSKEKSTRLSSDVLDIDFYEYANNLYFSKYITEDSSLAYVTSEGSDSEELKLGKVKMTAIPELSNEYSGKTFAYYENDDETFTICYTSNGRTFKQIASGVTFED